MRLKISERNRLHRRKLLYISPISLVVIFLLFISSDYVPYREMQDNLGWKGEMLVLPEITILPDHDPFESFTEKRTTRPLTSLKLNIITETGRAEGGTTREHEEKDIIPLPQNGFDDISTRPTHSDIPYSEDYIILKMVNPVYPTEELLNGIEGEVTLEILVNESGNVENAWVLSLLGPKSFEHASLDFVKQFRFQPPIMNGAPTPMSIRFQITFKIKDKHSIPGF